MSKRKKKALSKPSQAYLISFGDTMTAMLAFFIVLNSLAKDQTGANMHAGTGSFSAAIRGLGLPGRFKTKRARETVKMNDSSPSYIAGAPDEAEHSGTKKGPDSGDNQVRSVDRDAERAQRIINELSSQFAFAEDQQTSSRVEFDLFESVRSEKPYLPSSARQLINQSLRLLLAGTHRMEVILWARMPSRTTIEKSSRRADEINQFYAQQWPPRVLSQVQFQTRLWSLRDEKRPTVTIAIIKVQPR